MQKSIPRKTDKTRKMKRVKTWISAQNAVLLFKFKGREVRQRSEVCIEKVKKIDENQLTTKKLNYPIETVSQAPRFANNNCCVFKEI